jgi:hypothetical protein
VVEPAKQACELTGWTNADFFDILGATYTEAGEFDAVVKSQTRANAVSHGRVSVSPT